MKIVDISDYRLNGKTERSEEYDTLASMLRSLNGHNAVCMKRDGQENDQNFRARVLIAMRTRRIKPRINKVGANEYLVRVSR